MVGIKVQITKYIGDDPQPGIVECSSNSRSTRKKLKTVDLAKRVSALERSISRIAKSA